MHAKFHLDPSNSLATVHQRHRQTDRHPDRTDNGLIASGKPFYKRSTKNQHAVAVVLITREFYFYDYITWFSELCRVFSEHELVHVRYMLSPVRLSVTLVHPTQPVEIFGNVSMPFW